MRFSAVTLALRPRTALTVVKITPGVARGGFASAYEPLGARATRGNTRYGQCHTVRKRFIVWHTVRIDSSCAHVSTCGPHSKLCATIRGPPCKQGATSTTLHVFSFVAQQLSKIKLPSAFEKLTLCPPFRTHASSFSWLHPSINFTMFCREKPIFPLNWDIHGIRQALSEGFGHLGNQTFLWRFGSEVWGEWCETM